jgi:uncharacterized membrane protein
VYIIARTVVLTFNVMRREQLLLARSTHSSLSDRFTRTLGRTYLYFIKRNQCQQDSIFATLQLKNKFFPIHHLSKLTILTFRFPDPGHHRNVLVHI